MTAQGAATGHRWFAAMFELISASSERRFGKEVRVLKPGGTFRFWEHVRNDESRLGGTVQDVIKPAWRWFGAGCTLNRRTLQAIEHAGFRIEWLERIAMRTGVPAIYGVARPG